MNHYCDIWFWRASDQAAVARHLTDRTRMSGEPDAAPRRAGLLRSALLPLLRMGRAARAAGRGRPLEREETPVRDSCDCGGGEVEYREPVLDDGEWVLRCPHYGRPDLRVW